jgi:hypothetical protein
MSLLPAIANTPRHVHTNAHACPWLALHGTSTCHARLVEPLQLAWTNNTVLGRAWLIWQAATLHQYSTAACGSASHVLCCKTSNSTLAENMQRHPTPARKAAHSCKAAHARKTVLCCIARVPEAGLPGVFNIQGGS